MTPGQRLKVLKGQAPTGARSNMPAPMVAGIEAIINAALNGKVAQIEIAVGVSETENKKVRLVAVPEGFGELVQNESDGRMVRVLVVPDVMGDIVKVGGTE